jgi:hypothetical protein
MGRVVSGQNSRPHPTCDTVWSGLSFLVVGFRLARVELGFFSSGENFDSCPTRHMYESGFLVS